MHVLSCRQVQKDGENQFQRSDIPSFGPCFISSPKSTVFLPRVYIFGKSSRCRGHVGQATNVRMCADTRVVTCVTCPSIRGLRGQNVESPPRSGA